MLTLVNIQVMEKAGHPLPCPCFAAHGESRLMKSMSFCFIPIRPTAGPLAAGRSFPRDGKGTKGSPGAPSERFPGTFRARGPAAKRWARVQPLLPAKGKTARRFPPLDPPSGDERQKPRSSRQSGGFDGKRRSNRTHASIRGHYGNRGCAAREIRDDEGPLWRFFFSGFLFGGQKEIRLP